MTTRQDLRNLMRRRLGDNAPPYSFSDLQVNQWINDAIAEYSLHFPRQLSSSIECVEDQQAYDLPVDFSAMLSVEYPAAEDPPTYLVQRSYPDHSNWDTPGCYDILQRNDASDPCEIRISARPADGESLWIEYLAQHPSLDDDSDTCTVPDRHLELLVLFVRWTAYQELAMQESIDPDPTNLALGTLELNAYRAERLYRKLLETCLVAASHSRTSRWVMDRWESGGQ